MSCKCTLSSTYINSVDLECLAGTFLENVLIYIFNVFFFWWLVFIVEFVHFDEFCESLCSVANFKNIIAVKIMGG